MNGEIEMKIEYDHPKIKRYRQGKDPRGIKAAIKLINNWDESVKKHAGPYGGLENVYRYYAVLHGVTSTTVRNRTQGILRLFNIRKRERT